MTRSTLLTLLTLSTLVGCDPEKEDDTSVTVDDTAVTGDDTGSGEDGLLADDFESDLPLRVACTDTSVHAWNDVGDVGLTFWAQGSMAAALKAGSLDISYDLSAETAGVSLVVEVTEAGQAGINYCTDALSERTVLATYTATSGSATLSIVLDGNGEGDATLTLDSVMLTDAAGHTVSAEALTLSDVHVVSAWGG